MNNSAKKNNLGGLLVVISGALWGTTAISINRLSALGLSSYQETFCRTLLAIVILLVYILIKDPKILRISIKDIWMFLGTGILSQLLFNICYFTSIQTMGVSVAVVLLYTSPVFVVLLSALLFKERINRKKIIALCLALLSCVLISNIFGNSNDILPINLLIGIGAGFFYSLYGIFARFAVNKYPPLTITFYTFLFALIGCMPISQVTSLPTAYWSAEGIIFTLIFTVCNTVLPQFLYTKGLESMLPGKAAVLVTVEPVVGMIVGVAFLGEPVYWTKIVGGILMIFAILLLITEKNDQT